MLTKAHGAVLSLGLLAACASTADVAGVVDVVDGDSFRVGGVSVRLHGIDAPEHSQTCQTEHGADWACGAWVSAQVTERYDGAFAQCTQVDTDRYGRVVAKCRVDGQDVGERLVQMGLAFAYRTYSWDYDLDEKAAAMADRGLHGFVVQEPAQYRQTRATGRTPPDPRCAIKGNISKSGRIYHRPGQVDYARTGINLARGERWFCSASEAEAAGWRPASR